ncbi:hypothetical protein BBD42_16400 [Paenibacillus sp. BIHB 4019]|uniref:Uncharacterized protein n=1 Tax=Paenibacillus sp. BIHB 4019 TaxID=1870819 RepID=A0A1B2DJH7_9BACL|nr:hypothetical protein [Paenibacillus sp. BIHB 4019]ANY67877.1 hypothetical protein BBD42_16400 [Paenibacillus sp. BIHB 4019]
MALQKVKTGCFNRDGKRYNGFIFRVQEQDLPAYFNHFIGATTGEKFEKPITTLAQLGEQMKETIVWRIGERSLWHTEERFRADIDFLKLGKEEIKKQPLVYKETLTDAAFMAYILEDYQIVLTKSIEANRIIRVIPPTEQFGTILYKNKKHRYDKRHLKEAQRFD